MSIAPEHARRRQATPERPHRAASDRPGGVGRWLPAAYLGVPMLVLHRAVPRPDGDPVPDQHRARRRLHRRRPGRSTRYTALFTDPLYREVAVTTIFIATIAMVAQLVVGVPLAYVMAFKAGRFELPLLLGLVVLDGLNPVVRIYAWRMLLGRNGHHQRLAGVAGHHRRAAGRAAVQQCGGHRRAVDELDHLHGDPDLRVDEGDRRQPLPGRRRPRRGLVDDHAAHPAAAGGAGHLRRGAAGLHPAVHRLRDADHGRRHQRLHARPGRQRPDPRPRRHGLRCRAELHPAGLLGASWPRSPTGCRGSTAWRVLVDALALNARSDSRVPTALSGGRRTAAC